MAVARVRCAHCRNYVRREEVYHDSGMTRICSEDCLTAYMERRRVSARAKERTREKARPRKKANTLDPLLRKKVRARDGNVCRYCGQRGEQVHHILYRSQGGPDCPNNLILLCTEHHMLVHSNKRHWQPILLAVLWMGYVQGRWMTVPEAERHLAREGLLHAMAA